MFWWSDIICAFWGIDRTRSGTNTAFFRDRDMEAEQQEAARLKHENVERWKKLHPAVISFAKQLPSDAHSIRFINNMAGRVIVSNKRDLYELFQVKR